MVAVAQNWAVMAAIRGLDVADPKASKTILRRHHPSLPFSAQASPGLMGVGEVFGAPRRLQRAPSSPHLGLADEGAEVGQGRWVHRYRTLDQPSHSRSKRVWPQRNTPIRIFSAGSVGMGRFREKSFTHRTLTLLCPWRSATRLSLRPGCDAIRLWVSRPLREPG